MTSPDRQFKRLLVANRSEIAIRVFRHELLMGLALGLGLGTIGLARTYLMTPEAVLENPDGRVTPLPALTCVIGCSEASSCGTTGRGPPPLDRLRSRTAPMFASLPD